MIQYTAYLGKRSRMTRIGALVTLALAAATQAAVVFSDDFSEPTATVIHNKAPDVGGLWEDVNSNGITVSDGGTLDTAGAARYVRAAFSSALGSGQTLTLTFDAGLYSNSGFGVLTLRTAPGGAESFFIGTLGGTSRGAGGDDSGGAFTSSLGGNSELLPIVFTYTYDTGAWSYSGPGGSGSGTGTSNLALSTLDIRNNFGGDINVDNIVVSIVPEPASAVMFGLGGVLMIFRRRRAN